MQLYFSPLACSLAVRITCYEAGLPMTFIEVDTQTQRASDGSDYQRIHPLGQVPALRTEDGGLLTESAAILPYLAGLVPQAGLMPEAPLPRARAHAWLAFTATELHKVVFVPLLDPKAPPDVKTYARSKAHARLSWLSQQLDGRSHLCDAFSVADAYLVAILNWCGATQIDLTAWPTLSAYTARQRERPSVQRALTEELALYKAQQARRQAT